MDLVVGKDGKKHIQNEIANLIVDTIKSIKELSRGIRGLGVGLAIAGVGPIRWTILGVGAIITLGQFHNGTFYQSAKVIQSKKYVVDQEFFKSEKYNRVKTLVSEIERLLELQGFEKVINEV